MFALVDFLILGRALDRDNFQQEGFILASGLESIYLDVENMVVGTTSRRCRIHTRISVDLETEGEYKSETA